jgi:crotonobetainyl-CoA:carnitine CoA-transferase CaiB-like acyl-CoA transferase
MSAGPLAGVRVVELGQLIAGPMAGRMLADFGAEVIKVEPPGTGDPMREWGLNRFQGHGLWWPLQSRNKKLVTLDLRQGRGRELLLKLAGRSDVLVENFRPGTLERWGLGPEQLHEANPGLVIARVSGYGQTGPYAQRAGFASVGEAMGGLRYLNGYPGQVPPRPGVSLGDSLAAMFAVQGILMALYHRDVNGGRGQVVDASILESCFAMLDSTVPEYGKLGVVREPQGSRIGSAVPSNVYTTRDGKYLAVAANADNIFRRLCAAIGRPELADDDRFANHWARFEHVDELDSIVGDWVGEHDAAEADRILNEAGVVSGLVYSIADIFEDPHYRAREMLVTMHDEVLGEVVVPGVVPKLSETPGELRHAGSWELGRDNRGVYIDLLGLDERQLSELAAQGVI